MFLRIFLLFAFLTLAAAADPIPDVQGTVRLPDGLELVCQDARLEVHVLAPDLVRVRAVRNEPALQPDHSWALDESQHWTTPSFDIAETPTAVTLTTAALQVSINRSPLLIRFFDRHGHAINEDFQPMDLGDPGVTVWKTLGFDEHFYGMGEKAAHLDKRRGHFTMWTTDNPGWTYGSDPLYQSIPFYIGWQDQRAYGIFFDNSYKTEFDFGSDQNETVRFSAAGGDIDYYFLYGPSLKHVLGLYADLTGHPPMPPAWAMGHQQSRWSYYPAALVEQLVHRYRQERLPLDVVHLDIHYMDEYRVFTWSPTRFPNPGQLIADLLKQGVHVVTIVDPGIKYEPGGHYAAFNDGTDFFLREKGGKVHVGRVWPGDAVFVDYTLDAARRWWGDLHHALLDVGVAGIWNDMNEPADFTDKPDEAWKNVVWDDQGQHSPYARMRNLFALLEARATFEGLQRLHPRQRPFIITRSGFAGIQRYATMWTGDNRSTWDNLGITLPEFLSLGMSGETFIGCDIGGFSGRCNGELLTRWYQLGFLTPLCRNHQCIDAYDHEPWRFGQPYEDIIRKFLQLRYRLMPYLYTVMEEAHRTGVPWLRPLVLEFPRDPNTADLDDELMVGDSLLLAPVSEPGATRRDVYLPPGLWYDFWTSRPVQGGRRLSVSAP
ncbi:MAG TPA: TIM-barrel domain-containing protein, partial [Candidatus Xenobia bacterium]